LVKVKVGDKLPFLSLQKMKFILLGIGQRLKWSGWRQVKLPFLSLNVKSHLFEEKNIYVKMWFGEKKIYPQY